MNAVDLTIIGGVTLTALMGLKSGFLKPVSGIGGLVLGVVLATQHTGAVSELLVEQIEAEALRRVASFILIVAAAAAGTRAATDLVKKMLSALVLGWVDHAAGAVAGAVLAIMMAGTAVYVLSGAGFGKTRDALAASSLATGISRASLISTSTPWCSSIQEGEVTGDYGCTDLKGVFNQVLGRHISVKVDGLLGEDPGALADVVKDSLSGPREDLKSLIDTHEKRARDR